MVHLNLLTNSLIEDSSDLNKNESPFRESRREADSHSDMRAPEQVVNTPLDCIDEVGMRTETTGRWDTKIGESSMGEFIETLFPSYRDIVTKIPLTIYEGCTMISKGKEVIVTGIEGGETTRLGR
jgi:hypothetical protein